MRAFIAVELTDALKEEAASLQADLRATGADVKWVEPAHLHLTLKFLGEIQENQVEPLKSALTASVQGLSPFATSLEGIGAFPSTTRPRVIWVGVSQGKEALERLAGQVEEACAGLGFAGEERPFSAHLTIGRVRGPDRVASLIKKLQVVEFHGNAPAPIDRVILFQSILSPHGPAYTPLAEIPLAPGDDP
ncbi:MAG: RNA 2',3'-cyclic phosphodiesterase [Candidatus Omnitrophica bacterium]|nr:RNA 2',3'-cyclic phosphodiesterase [Candidatus Omnitrophota bacterium]